MKTLPPFAAIGTTVVALVFLRCTVGPVAGGTNAPNGVVGVVRRPDQTPAALIPVRLFDASEEPSGFAARVVDSTRTDNAGRYRFDSLSPGDYRTEAVSETDFLAVLTDFRIEANQGEVAVEGTLSHTSDLTGMLDAPFDTATRILVVRTPYCAQVDSGGRFLLRGLPAGTHVILAVQVNSSGYPIALWDIDTVIAAGAAQIIDTLRPRPLGTGEVLIDDFEDGDPYPPSGGGWYSFYNVAHGGNAVVTPAFTGDSLIAAPGNNGSQWCLRVQYDLGTIAPYYGGAGVALAVWMGIPRIIDLSGARVVRFSVKGPGQTLRVVLKAHGRPFEAALLSVASLGDQWTSYAVDLDTVRAMLREGDPPTTEVWPLLRRGMSSIDFVCEAGLPRAQGELWIDDVSITYGP